MNWATSMKCFALLSLLFLSACIPSMELHGGLNPRPSKMPDLGFMAIGTTFDAGMIAAKVPWQARIPADAVAALALRNVCFGLHCRYFGRSVDSHFMFVIGIYPPEFIRFITHAHKHNKETH